MFINFVYSNNNASTQKFINKLYAIITHGKNATTSSNADKKSQVIDYLNNLSFYNESLASFADSLNESDMNDMKQLLSMLSNKQNGGKRKSRKQNYRRNLTRRRQYGGWPPSDETKGKIIAFLLIVFLCIKFPMVPAGLIMVWVAGHILNFHQEVLQPTGKAINFIENIFKKENNKENNE
jgi:hypothetical protein